MPAYSYRVGTTYLHTGLNEKFTVLSVDEHDFDPDLTEVEIVWENGEWQSIYADDFGHDVKPLSGPKSLNEDEKCDCKQSAYGWNEGEYYCLSCGGK